MRSSITTVPSVTGGHGPRPAVAWGLPGLATAAPGAADGRAGAVSALAGLARALRLPAIAAALLIVALAPPGLVAAAADGAPTISPRPSSMGSEEPSPPHGAAPTLYRRELEERDTLGVGRVDDDVARQLPGLEAFSAYLGDHLSGFGYQRARPVIAQDNREMISFLGRGIVDVATETPMSAIHFVKAGGATIILRERRRGHASCRSIVFVRADSPIRTLAELRGRRIAFEDAGSTTSFLLPLAAIKRSGDRTVALETPSTAAPADAVGYFFAGSGSSIVAAVTRRTADAGAVSDEDWNSLGARQPAVAALLRVIHQSEEVPRAFVLTGPTVAPAQREAIRALLLVMDKDAAGRAVLERLNQVEGFDPIDNRLQRQIDSLGESWELVREETTR